MLIPTRLHTVAFPEKGKEASPSFNFKFRYIDDVLSLSNAKLHDFIDRIYPNEPEKATNAARFAQCIDLHLDIDSEGRLETKL